MYKHITDYFYDALAKNKRLNVTRNHYFPVNELRNNMVCIYVSGLRVNDSELFTNKAVTWTLDYKIDCYSKGEYEELEQLTYDMFTMVKQALQDAPKPNFMSYNIVDIENIYDIGSPSSVCVSFTLSVLTTFK